MKNLKQVTQNTFNALESAQQDFEIGLVSVEELVKGLVKENEDLKNQISDLQEIIIKFIEDEKNK